MRVVRFILSLLVLSIPVLASSSEEFHASGSAWGHDLHKSVAGDEVEIAATVSFLNSRYGASLETDQYMIWLTGITSMGATRIGNVISIMLDVQRLAQGRLLRHQPGCLGLTPQM